MRHTDHRLRHFVASCVFSSALFVPCVGRAAGVSPVDATPDQRKEATDHFNAGKRALAAQSWDKAIVELRASLEAVDSPNARLELARALRDSGNPGEAWSEFGRAGDDATKLSAKEERYAKTADAAATERSDLEGKLAFVAASVEHAPPNATLKVGDRVVAPAQWSAPLVVPPGTIDVVVADATGKELSRQTVTATVGQTTPVLLDARGAAAEAPRAAVEASDDDKPHVEELPKAPGDPSADASSGPTKLRPYAYVAAGIGVAGLATFTVFGLMSNATYADLQSACPHGCPPEKRDEISRGRMQQTIANIGLGVGLAGIAAGATLFLVSMPPKTASPSAALVVGPGYLGLRGSL